MLAVPLLREIEGQKGKRMGRRGRGKKEGAWPLLGGEGRQQEGRGTEGGIKKVRKGKGRKVGTGPPNG